jgi:hypothetical protein
MIKDNECKIEITTRNKKYYNDKNYNCEVGDVISIDITKMPKKSHNIITAICEICKCERELSFVKYNINFNRGGFYSCKMCSDVKRKKTTFEKYGVEYAAQRLDQKEKKSKWMSSKEFRDKSNKTQIDKYGVLFVQTDKFRMDNSIKHKEIIKNKKERGEYNCNLSLPINKELRDSAMFEKYGHTYSSHVESIKDKIQKTNLERYGHISPFGNINVSNKIKKTLLEKYGVDNPFKSKEIQYKIKKYLKENYYTITIDDKFKKYRNKVRYLTNKIKEELFDNWDGFDYYDGEYIKDYLKLNSNNNKYPTIDHKISCIYGYKNNIGIEILSNIENLCITKRIINSQKNHLNENEFISILENK